MNDIQEKIANTGKMVSVMLFIVCALSAIAMISFLAGIGVILFSNEALPASLQAYFGGAASAISVELLQADTLILLFIFGVIRSGIIFSLLFILHRIFSDISRSYTPFEKKQARRMKKVAVIALILGISEYVFESIAQSVLNRATAGSIDLIWFVLAVVIYCMAQIFDYGCQLQSQSDETL